MIWLFTVLLSWIAGNGWLLGASNEGWGSKSSTAIDTGRIHFPGERHFVHVRQLTFGGDNAEAYWSFDGKKLVFQRTDHQQVACDQIFWGEVGHLLTSTAQQPFHFRMVSTGKGRTTCAFFLPGDSLILYSSTHLAADSCPKPPDRKKLNKYLWPLYDSYEIFVSDLQGRIVRQLTDNRFYDAEATLSPQGDKIIFTSTRDGDLELYTMDLYGKNVRRITHRLGYDGGAWFSPDGSQIVWRAHYPTSEEEKQAYLDLLKQGLVAPGKMEIWVANADGSHARQVTQLGGANWAPVFTPDGKKIIFASNHRYARGFPFDLFLVNLDGTGLEQVTFSDSFDAFPMFSPDGKYIVWCSNRNNGGSHATNIFIAEWIP